MSQVNETTAGDECWSYDPITGTVFDGLGKVVCTASTHDDGYLISAVRELYEACRKANTCASLPDAVKELAREAVAKARPAIPKAR